MCPASKAARVLEPGEAISPADLEAAEQAGGFRVEEGDVLVCPYGSARNWRRRRDPGLVQQKAGRTRAACPAVAARPESRA